MHLYSFVGSLSTDPIRKQLSLLQHPRGLIKDTSNQNDYIWWEAPPEVKAQFRQEYADTLRQSKFILCPRGISPSTVRLFETMKTGRVPVILSDDWVAPVGPDWDTFSVRVPEARIAELPAILEERETNSERMGAKARTAWESWFSPAVHFHRIVEWCLEIQSTRPLPERWGQYLAYADFCTRPVLLRQWIKDAIGSASAHSRRLLRSR
jgi:hypothetical protein